MKKKKRRKKEVASRKPQHDSGSLIIIIMIAGLLAVGLSPVHFRPPVEANSKATKTADLQLQAEKAEKMKTVIAQVEVEFFKLGELLAAKKINPDLRKKLEAPFNLAALNRNNDQRNYEQLRLVVAPGQRVTIKNPDFFFYGFLPSEDDDLVGSYSSARKLVGLRKSFDAHNFVHLSDLFHELQHVIQDNNLRAQNKVGEWQKHNDQGYGDQDEVEAYSLELELLNALTDGYIEAQATRNQVIDVFVVCQKLGISPEQAQEIESSLTTAQLYYPRGMADNIFYDRFVEYLDKVYPESDFETYEIYID